ncbi:12960_t:CDS:2, partial [Funneliformis geosporum]
CLRFLSDPPSTNNTQISRVSQHIIILRIQNKAFEDLHVFELRRTKGPLMAYKNEKNHSQPH